MRGWLTDIFILSAALILYVMIGYPLVLVLLARVHNKRVRKNPQLKTVTVLLPVRNGGPWIRAKLESLLALRYPPELIEVLVISNGSTDDTDAIVGSFSGAGNVHLLHVAGGGKAAALNAGLERATGEVLFMTDVRQALDPDSLSHLVACFADPSVGVASGELIIRDGETQAELSVGLYWKYEKWLRKRQSRIDSVMGATGCIYAMRRELARPLPVGTLADDMFLPLNAFFRGYRIILEENAKAYDFPTSLQPEFRRKVRTLAGVYQVIGEYPALLGPRNRMWIHFVSHKLARLLLPFAFLAMAVTTFWLPEPWLVWMLAAQILFYGLAALDPWIPDGPVKRVSSPARTFVVLFAAALAAGRILLPFQTDFWKEA